MTGGPLRTAEIIAVGSEMLGDTRLDTNSLYLASRLASLGIVLRRKFVVGDDRADLISSLQSALARADVVILTGGLGPTDDDITRETVASWLELELQEEPAIVETIARRFAKRGLRMPAVNRKQALVPRGATVLPNPHGTAPGLLIFTGSRIVVMLPGPPRELQPMFEAVMVDVLAPRAGGDRLHQAVLFVAGRGESHVEEVAQPLYAPWTSERQPIATTILASPGMIELHLTLRSPDGEAAARRLGQARDALVAALGPDVFSTDGRTMDMVAGDLLRDGGMTIAVAESCTGGLLMSRLTDVPGSSAYALCGVVAYSNEAKTALAGVPPQLIQAHGAVSEPVAIALADGIRARSGAAIGVGVTGIAGPGGGTPQKPVGTVAIAVSGIGPGRVRTHWFAGGRPQVKFLATQAALDMVRRALLEV
ncbi:competence/damage-inducible protein A [soil metagenome]